jgi:hypothetical protein
MGIEEWDFAQEFPRAVEKWESRNGILSILTISNTPSHTTHKVHRIVVWNVEERLGGLHLSITRGSLILDGNLTSRCVAKESVA